MPFFVKWPKALPQGVENASPVAGIDIFATAAAAAGAALPSDRVIDGADLVPFATGAKAGRPHDALFWRSGHYRVVRAGDWKLQLSERPAKAWLFDLANDPTEQVNLAEREPLRVAELTARLDAHAAGQSAPLWPSLLEAAVRIDPPLGVEPRPDDEYVYWAN
jgi:arylsulfatase A-like enzyme